MAVRQELHRRGLRFRVNVPVPGLPRRTMDIGWKGRRIAVYLDGCYWHACPEHSSLPKVNSAYWTLKIQKNRQRDTETDEYLRKRGWTVLRFWEHTPVEEIADEIEQCVRSRT